MNAPRLPETYAAILSDLVIGRTRQAIAEARHVGLRTVDRGLAEVKVALGTTQPFCLGVRAVRWRLVPARYPIAQAIAQRSGERWHQPVGLNREVAQLLAAGLDVGAAAVWLRMSCRTLRRRLSALARANGAGSLVHLGALTEALGWIGSSGHFPPDSSSPIAATHRPS